MNGEPDNQSAWIKAGQRHENAHLLDAALRAYLKGSAWYDAARIFCHHGRFRDAGEVLLLYLPEGEIPVGRLTADMRRHMLESATCFARAGALREAVGLLQNLGESGKAAALLKSMGRMREAVSAMRGEALPGSPWPPGLLYRLRHPPTFEEEDIDTQESPLTTLPGAEPLGPSTLPLPPPTSRRRSRAEEPPQEGGRRFFSDTQSEPHLLREGIRDASPEPAEEAPSILLISVGATIDDRYRIGEFLGAGGMASVYKAYDLQLQEDVALKIFRPMPGDDEGLRRFRREMKLSRRLTHPNVVRLFEFGTWHGARFISMELLEGEDLRKTFERLGPLPVDEVLRIMVQVCDGLGAAHDLDIVHRDIKPQNLFLVEGGRRVKVMDFGVAKAADTSIISITGVRVGTPRYMSPEQIQGRPVSAASDMYALGGVMYELLTGEPAFSADSLMPLLLKHLTEDPPPPRRYRRDLPRDVEYIILRLLEKDPMDRYRTTAELKSALVKAYAGAMRGAR